jgi:hypothetical protein
VGNNYGSYGLSVDGSACNISCKTNASQICGGVLYNSVYVTGMCVILCVSVHDLIHLLTVQLSWVQWQSSLSPAPRAAQTASLMGTSNLQMFIFGGNSTNPSDPSQAVLHNDLWVFSLSTLIHLHTLLCITTHTNTSIR